MSLRSCVVMAATLAAFMVKADPVPAAVAAEKPLEQRHLAICLFAPQPGEVGRFCDFIRNHLAKGGFDTLVLQVGYAYRFERHPECASANAICRGDVKKIVAACRETGIALVPEMPLFGHQGWLNVVKDGILHAYPEMDESYGKKEIPHNYCRSICPKHPGAQKLVFELMDEITEVCEAKTMHVGCDEVFAIGLCPRCAKTPKATLFADWVNGLVRHNRARGVRTMIWGDRLLDGDKTPYGAWEASRNGTSAALRIMDKDLIVCDWHYKKYASYPSVETFCDAGLETWVCPWRSLRNARLFIDYAKKHERGKGLAGIMLTTWFRFADVADAIEGKPLRTEIGKDKNVVRQIRGVAEVFHAYRRNCAHTFPNGRASCKHDPRQPALWGRAGSAHVHSSNHSKESSGAFREKAQ